MDARRREPGLRRHARCTRPARRCTPEPNLSVPPKRPMHDTPSRPRRAPIDQAHGLRRLFAGSGVRHIALVANPHVAFSGVRARAADRGARRGRAEHAGRRRRRQRRRRRTSWPRSTCPVASRRCRRRCRYLAARGLPLRHVDTRGVGRCCSTRWRWPRRAPRSMLRACRRQRPGAAVPGARARPLLLAADQPDSVTHAYAAMQAAGAALRADELRPAAGRGAASPRAARASPSSWAAAPTTSSAPRCATGSRSTRPATCATRPAPRWRSWCANN